MGLADSARRVMGCWDAICLKKRGIQMRVDDLAGNGACKLLPATSQDTIIRKKRGFEMRVDDVAGNGPDMYCPPRHRTP